jgi:hypothetical protein
MMLSWGLSLSVAVLVSAPAFAGSVYLNGVNIDGIVNQKFERATVRIDEKGNVLIDAPGYSAKPVADGPSGLPQSVAPPRLARRYWLVTEQTAAGMTEYDVDVYVNSKWIRKLKNGEDQQIVELTPHLLPGKNSVLFSAKKITTGRRKSMSREHVFRVLVGEGNAGGEHVMLDSTLAKFERTAADTGDDSREFMVLAR